MLIIGAKGFAKELLAIFSEDPEQENWVFFDDLDFTIPDILYNKFSVIRTMDEAKEYFLKKDNRFSLGIGRPSLRAELYKKFTAIGGIATSIISSKTTIGMFGNTLGDGLSILQRVIIETDNTIGKGTLIHAGVLISHDCRIGEFCELSPQVQVLGNVHIGDFCSIGTGAILLPGIRIGNNVTIGAGAVVTKNIGSNATVVGVPAIPLKKN